MRPGKTEMMISYDRRDTDESLYSKHQNKHDGQNAGNASLY